MVGQFRRDARLRRGDRLVEADGGAGRWPGRRAARPTPGRRAPAAILDRAQSSQTGSTNAASAGGFAWADRSAPVDEAAGGEDTPRSSAAAPAAGTASPRIAFHPRRAWVNIFSPPPLPAKCAAPARMVHSAPSRTVAVVACQLASSSRCNFCHASTSPRRSAAAASAARSSSSRARCPSRVNSRTAWAARRSSSAAWSWSNSSACGRSAFGSASLAPGRGMPALGSVAVFAAAKPGWAFDCVCAGDQAGMPPTRGAHEVRSISGFSKPASRSMRAKSSAWRGSPSSQWLIRKIQPCLWPRRCSTRQPTSSR